jgi:hypothetical protein
MSKANISLLTSGCSLDHCDFQFDEEEIAMSHSFQVPDDLYTELATYAARRGQSPDVLLMDLVKEGVEQLKQTDSMAALRKIPYDPAHDPLAPFIGAFDSGNDEPGWIERHDEFFAGRGEGGKRYGNKR